MVWIVLIRVAVVAVGPGVGPIAFPGCIGS